MNAKKVTLLLIIMIIGAILVWNTPVYAAESENITYTTSPYYGYATVTGYSGWCSGTLEIPSELGGYPVKQIADNAFKGKNYLTEVVIPEGVTSIGSYAFYGTGLTRVILPDSLTGIGSYAFSSSSITELRFGSNIPYIGASAFQGCTKLVDVYIDDITTWAKIDFSSMTTNPLYYADNLYVNDVLTTEVVLDEGITRIGQFAFANFQGLKGITIPSTVTGIKDSAFKDCKALTKVNITDIASWCSVSFYGSNSTYSNPLYYAGRLYLNDVLITDLVIPEGVTTIKDDVFRNCKSIKSVSLPSTLTSISGNPFNNCSSISNVYITDIVSWCNVRFSFSESNPTYWSNSIFLNGESLVNLEIPADVTEIKPYAFYNCDTIESVTVLGALESIGEEAFYGCDNLVSLDLGDTVGSINSKAFTNTGIYNDENNWDNGVLYLNGILIKADTSLQGEYAVKEGTTAIVGEAFQNCSTLTGITMPDTVISIGDSAFYGCSKLSSVVLSNSLKSLGKQSFYNCYALISISIPNGVEEIQQQTFYSCHSLSHVSLGLNVKSIGNSAFHGCVSLWTINFPYSLTSIGSYAFEMCMDLDVDIDIPNVTHIGSYAFLNCENTNNIVLSSSLTTISTGAFKGAGWASKLTIPDSVKSIQSEAFYGTRLEEVTFGAGIESIGADAFKNCNFVKKITITNLEKWCEINFGNVYSNLMYLEKPVYIGDSQLTGDLVIPEGVEYINPYAFMYCNEFSALILSDTVKEIHTDAFTYCSSLKKIIFGKNVTTIYSKAFYNCGNISTIALNKNLNSIGSEAFSRPFIKKVWYEGDNKSDIVIDSTNAFSSSTWYYNISIIDGHIYNYACDPDCNECGLTRTITQDYHVYDNICDTTCNVCNGVRTVIHNCGDWINLDTTSHVRTCVCGYIETELHIFSTWQTERDATCTDAGLEQRVCFKCDFKEVRSIPVSHSYSQVVTSPTCLTQGYTTYTCACGDTYKDAYVAALNHQSVNGICSRCGETLPYIVNGDCGENLVWMLSADGILTISGKGEMSSYSSSTSYSPWYKYRDSVEKVVIEDGVTSVGNYAFYYCNKLTTIALPNGITKIGSHAFYNCRKLTSITIPSGVSTIPSSAFALCKSLSTISIPTSITNIESLAFYYCDNLKTVYFYCGSQSEWDSIKIGNYNDPIKNATIEFHLWQDQNTTGSNKCVACGYKTTYIGLTSVTIRPSVAGIYFTGTFDIGEEIEVVRSGVAVSLYNQLPVADGSDSQCLCSEGTTSVLVTNILNAKYDDNSNAMRAVMPIYARAYVELSDGTYIYSDVVAVKLREVTEVVDAEWSTLDDVQKAAITAMYFKFKTVLDAWDLTNIGSPSVEPVADVLIISDTQTISNQTIDTDVYITSTGVATFNNVTVNGNIYCYGQLKASGCVANDVYAYAYGSMMSCDAFDGTHGKVSGGISCNGLTIQDDALEYAFSKWGKQ